MHDLQLSSRVLKMMIKKFGTVKINNAFNEIILISSNIDRVPVRHILKK